MENRTVTIIGISILTIVIIGAIIWVAPSFMDSLKPPVTVSPIVQPVIETPKSVTETPTSLYFKVWAGNTSKNTEPFTITSPWVIQWATSGGEYSAFSIVVYNAETNNPLEFPVMLQQGKAEQTTYMYTSGYLYLNIQAINTAWYVKIIK